MADTINDGGPAFPCDSIVERNQKGGLVGVEISSSGMTLRDYFAIHASDKDLQKWLDLGVSRADARFRHADAMLKARDGE